MKWKLLWRAFKCFIRPEHLWVKSPGGRMRVCSCCHRREYLFFKGFGGRGCWVEHWYEHTYPLDADPAKDPTGIDIDGYDYKLGKNENLWVRNYLAN